MRGFYFIFLQPLLYTPLEDSKEVGYTKAINAERQTKCHALSKVKEGCLTRPHARHNL